MLAIYLIHILFMIARIYYTKGALCNCTGVDWAYVHNAQTGEPLVCAYNIYVYILDQIQRLNVSRRATKATKYNSQKTLQQPGFRPTTSQAPPMGHM